MINTRLEDQIIIQFIAIRIILVSLVNDKGSGVDTQVEQETVNDKGSGVDTQVE